MVLLYAVPMSVSVGMLKTSRATLQADIGLLLVITVALLAGVYVIAFGVIRYLARRELATSALQALAIALPAGPFVGPSLLPPLFGPASSALLIVAVALVGNIFMVPFTMVCLSMGTGQEKPDLQFPPIRRGWTCALSREPDGSWPLRGRAVGRRSDFS